MSLHNQCTSLQLAWLSPAALHACYRLITSPTSLWAQGWGLWAPPRQPAPRQVLPVTCQPHGRQHTAGRSITTENCSLMALFQNLQGEADLRSAGWWPASNPPSALISTRSCICTIADDHGCTHSECHTLLLHAHICVQGVCAQGAGRQAPSG
jgi:hypothetical protein